MIYLDHAATAPTTQAVLDAMWPYMTSAFGNPSSAHAMGRQAKEGLDAARSVLAEILGCRPGELIFTSGGTEADNLAIEGMALARPRGRHVVTTAIEHEAVLQSVDYLRRSHGFEVDIIGVDQEGRVLLDDLVDALRADTTLVSVMYGNNEVGTVQPLAEIAEYCGVHGVPLHTDAVQAAGQLPLVVGALGVQALSLSAHKFGGPRGVGLLYVDGAVGLEPTVHGGGQQQGRRSGTVNVAGAVGMAVALQTATPVDTDLRDQLIDGVLSTAPGAQLTGARTYRLPNHASFLFPGLNGETLLQELEAEDIVCSSGSACSADNEDASHVLLAMGYEEDEARTAVRFTLGTATTVTDIESVVAAVPRAVHRVLR